MKILDFTNYYNKKDEVEDTSDFYCTTSLIINRREND